MDTDVNDAPRPRASRKTARNKGARAMSRSRETNQSREHIDASKPDTDRKPEAKRERRDVPSMVQIEKIVIAGKGRTGRKPALTPTDDTLEQIRRLSAFQLTQDEIASALLVAPSTLKKFLAECDEARAAWEAGQCIGKASVKRSQFVFAHRSVAGAIWWGKQHLAQRDRIEERVDHTIQAGEGMHRPDFEASNTTALAALREWERFRASLDTTAGHA